MQCKLSCAEAAQIRCAALKQQQQELEQHHTQKIAEQASCLDAAVQAANLQCKDQESKV